LFQNSNFPGTRVRVHDGFGGELTYPLLSILSNHKELDDGKRIALDVYLIIYQRKACPLAFNDNDICRPVGMDPKVVEILIAISAVLTQISSVDLGKIVLVEFHQVFDY
jgi:hypothetical protein